MKSGSVACYNSIHVIFLLLPTRNINRVLTVLQLEMPCRRMEFPCRRMDEVSMQTDEVAMQTDRVAGISVRASKFDQFAAGASSRISLHVI
jgi:hypothetical protein